MKNIKDFKIILKENDNLKINLPSNYNNETLNQFLGKKREIETLSKPIINTKIIVNSEECKKSSKIKENNNKSNKQQILKKGCLEMSKIPFTCGEYFYFEKHQIGTGSFANVFCGTHKIKNFKVAIKVPNDKATSDMIDLEVKFTKLLQKEIGFPSLFHSYNINKKNIIVESLLGPSLDKLFNYCGKKFPLKTVCLIGVEILKRLQSMHKYGLIHRDLKPNNFTWGNFSLNNNNNNNLINSNNNINKEYNLTTIYLIDFGLSCPYIDMSNGLLYGNSKGNKFVGTLRYSSINSHKGVRLCRKDDLESLIYILIYFYKGKLPWQDVKGKDENEKHDKVKELKMKITTAELCEGMPDEFEKMLCYIKNILFDEYPNYNKLFNYFKAILDRIKTDNNEENDFNYIWEKIISENCNEPEYNSSNENKKDNISKIFQGYPDEIKKYIRKKYSNKTNIANISMGSSSDTKSNLSTSNSSEVNK